MTDVVGAPSSVAATEMPSAFWVVNARAAVGVLRPRAATDREDERRERVSDIVARAGGEGTLAMRCVCRRCAFVVVVDVVSDRSGIVSVSAREDLPPSRPPWPSGQPPPPPDLQCPSRGGRAGGRTGRAGWHGGRRTVRT